MRLPRITYVTRSFLDYRVPVFRELDLFCGHQLHVIYPELWTPERVRQKIHAVLGYRAVSMVGEKSIGDYMPQKGPANRTVCIPYQPGLGKAIARTLPDVIVGDGFFQWTFLTIPYVFLNQTPLVVCYERTFHTERNAQWYRSFYRQIVLKIIGAVSCNGRLSAEYTKWLGVPENRITIGHMAADLEGIGRQLESISQTDKNIIRKAWNSKGIVFLYVGRLIELKGVRQLLEAWRIFEEEMPDEGTLIIVGSGPEETDLKIFSQESKLKWVRFVGSVDYDKIVTYYASADVFIMPTLEDNWSLVVPEAMACGLPILTTIYNGCWPDLVFPNENGWIFDALDTRDILCCLRRCVSQSYKLKAMGLKSRMIVKSHTSKRAARAIYDACTISLTKRTRKRN